VTIFPPPEIQTVVIQFEGICVNFKRSDFPFLPAAHRIVLINASTITNVWGNTIDPHLAGFSTGPNPDPTNPLPVDELPLTGAIVQIANPVTTGTQTGVTYDSTYQAIPSLTQLTPGATPVSLAVLVGQNPELAACYFDVDFGTISSQLSKVGGATMTVVTIQTNGAPQYQMTPFATGLSSPPLLTAEFLPATNNMSFWNEEQSIAGARNNDFLLSYLVVSPPPASPNLPTSTGSGSTPNRKSRMLNAAAVSGQVGLQDFLTDFGCSNSTYP
jgi:hypothetical protein